MTDLAQLFAQLPPTTADALTRALELTRSNNADWTRERELWAEALTSVGFTRWPGNPIQREIPPASALTPEQRIVAEIVAHTPGAWINGFPLYQATWLARRWLGLEPGGVAFEDVEIEIAGQQVRGPRLNLLRRLLPSDQARAFAQLDALPLAQQIELLAIMALAPSDVHTNPVHMAIDALVPNLADRCEGGEPGWATRIADWVLERHAAPYCRGEGPPGSVHKSLARLLLAAIVCAGEPVEPRHDALLHLASGKLEAITRRCIEAIPEPRREAALLATHALMFDQDKVRVGLIYLPDYPYLALAEKIFEYVEQANDPKQALAELAAVAERHPELAARLAVRKAEIPELRVAAVLQPVTLDALDQIRRRQLEIAGKLYGGVDESAETILGRSDEDADERILPSFLELRTIVDEAGASVYDAWLYMVDSGTVFRHGTEEVVAEVIQFGVETSDGLLRAALPSVLASLEE